MEDKKNSLYDIFLNYSYSQLKQMFKKAETEDEKNFYMTLANLVLQKEQEKVIFKYINLIISSIAHLKSLTELNLSMNLIEDISPIKKLINLEKIEIFGNKIKE